MKKQYTTPEYEVIKVTLSAPLLSESQIESDDFGLDYGGVDDTGTIDPE